MINFKQLAEKNHEYVVEMRRQFHMHPELAGNEVWTSNKIKQELDAMGIENILFDNYNVVGIIDTGKAGKKIAIRGDIDALPMQELTDVPFKSQNDGVMHACGHDAHAANLLGVAKSLLEIKDQLTGKIYLCFQMGEENMQGATELVAYLKNEGGVDNAFGIHVFAPVEKGTLILPTGAFAAGVMSFIITVNGRGGHGSAPHSCIDPVRPACEIVSRIVSLPVNRIDAQDPVVVSPCMVHTGTAPNIIPDTAEIRGTIRYFNKNNTQGIQDLMSQTAENIALSYGATAKVTYAFDPIIPVINDKQCTLRGQDVGKEMGMEVFTDFCLMGSDNFAEFIDAFPGFYAGIGVANTEKGIKFEQHNSYFDIDEDALMQASEFLTRCAVEFLSK